MGGAGRELAYARTVLMPEGVRVLADCGDGGSTRRLGETGASARPHTTYRMPSG